MQLIRRVYIWWKWTRARDLVMQYRRTGRAAYLRHALKLKHQQLVFCEDWNDRLAERYADALQRNHDLGAQLTCQQLGRVTLTFGEN